MHNIEMQEMTEAFFQCWKAAGIHLNTQVDGGIQSWLRAPDPGIRNPRPSRALEQQDGAQGHPLDAR